MKPIELTMISLNAALYASLGYLTYLGIFAPIMGVVRFWGIAVVVPAIFATLFGPIVGGLGAAIGIFISDMIIHGNALLSITVGVPANFVMFYLIGRIVRINFTKSKFSSWGAILGGLSVVLLFIVGWYMGSNLSFSMALTFLFFGALCILLLFLFGRFWPHWKSFALASIIGNVAGSAIVGFGVWAFSQFFILPGTIDHELPIMTSLIWFTWTFSNQMPFLLVFCPPILKVCFRVFPDLISYRQTKHSSNS